MPNQISLEGKPNEIKASVSHLKMSIKRDSSNSKCVVYIRDPDSVWILKKKKETDDNFSLQHLGVPLQALRPPPRWRKAVSG